MASTETAKEVAKHHAEEVVQQKPASTWRSYIWDSLDKSPEERRFIFKLDLAILTFATLGYLIKYLDQANINNAFVSGMKEDLNLYGDQLNYMQTLWTVGYILGQIPSNLILTRVRPSIWIPSLEVAWSVLTFSLSRCNTAEQIYAVRFLVGLAESGFYPGMQYMIGSWYRSDELAKRSCIFQMSGAIGPMFSGYFQAAVYHLDGVGGFRGWQWLFLIDGIFSLPIALAGYFVLPDYPETCRVSFLTADEKAFAIKRMQAEGRKGRQPYTRAKIVKIFKSWHIYALTMLYIAYNNGNAVAAPVFAQYLKASKSPVYQIWQINVYPTTTYAVQVVGNLVIGWTSDSVAKGRRWPFFIAGGLVNIVCYISLAVWDISDGWKWTCLILMGLPLGLSGLAYAWAHEICSSDNEERALVTGTMNEIAYVVQAWLPLLVWQQVDAPRYRKGYITAACLSVLMIAMALVVRSLQKGETQRRDVEAAGESEKRRDLPSE